MASTAWQKKMNGIPTTKYQCLVLCRNRYIPAQVPMLPPSRLQPKSIFSGTRHICFIARLLSVHIRYTPNRFIIAKYSTIHSIALPSFPPQNETRRIQKTNTPRSFPSSQMPCRSTAGHLPEYIYLFETLFFPRCTFITYHSSVAMQIEL